MVLLALSHPEFNPNIFVKLLFNNELIRRALELIQLNFLIYYSMDLRDSAMLMFLSLSFMNWLTSIAKTKVSIKLIM